MRIGAYDVVSIQTGRFALDGGAMFGVVPKALWQRARKPDEHNRIAMDCNCLLVTTPTGRTLIDAGYGSKGGERPKRNHALDDGNPILDNLAAIGVSPEEIDRVILSHLHFDHAGGLTLIDETGKLQPVFPDARHIVQRAEWEDATGDIPELAGAYFKDDFLAVQKAGLLDIIEGDTEIEPGVRVQVTGGHTRGHQIILLESEGRRAAFLADLCPLTPHLRTMWTMSYDQDPLRIRRVKPEILRRAADENWLIIFEHDVEVRAGRIRRDEKAEFVVVEDA